jgi:hypothetical protein
LPDRRASPRDRHYYGIRFADPRKSMIAASVSPGFSS